MNKVNTDKSSLKALNTIENRNVNDQALSMKEISYCQQYY